MSNQKSSNTKRNFCSDINGKEFKESLIDRVWNKGTSIIGKNPSIWRKDKFGNIIKKDKYNTMTKFGWEIDHSKPVSKGGTDHINNLQPLQWETNRKKSDKYPYKPN